MCTDVHFVHRNAPAAQSAHKNLKLNSFLLFDVGSFHNVESRKEKNEQRQSYTTQHQRREREIVVKMLHAHRQYEYF